jgi:hypothetical protein
MSYKNLMIRDKYPGIYPKNAYALMKNEMRRMKVTPNYTRYERIGLGGPGSGLGFGPGLGFGGPGIGYGYPYPYPYHHHYHHHY